jgi:hypothetical protein
MLSLTTLHIFFVFQTAKQLAFYVFWLGISFSCNIFDITYLVDCTHTHTHTHKTWL